MVPLANRESYHALRAYVRVWTLAQRICEARRERGEKGKKGKGKEKAKGKTDNGEAKGNVWTDDSCVAGECGYCGRWRHKKVQCPKQKKDQGSQPPAAAVQAVATVNHIRSSDGSEDSFWVVAVSASRGRNARILVDSGADEHECRTNFASATPLGPDKGGMVYDAHGTRTLYLRPGPEGQSVGAEFRVMNVRTPILSMGKFTSNKVKGLRQD